MFIYIPWIVYSSLISVKRLTDEKKTTNNLCEFCKKHLQIQRVILQSKNWFQTLFLNICDRYPKITQTQIWQDNWYSFSPTQHEFLTLNKYWLYSQDKSEFIKIYFILHLCSLFWLSRKAWLKSWFLIFIPLFFFLLFLGGKREENNQSCDISSCLSAWSIVFFTSIFILCSIRHITIVYKSCSFTFRASR